MSIRSATEKGQDEYHEYNSVYIVCASVFYSLSIPNDTLVYLLASIATVLQIWASTTNRLVTPQTVSIPYETLIKSP
jgi:hypothetical protein